MRNSLHNDAHITWQSTICIRAESIQLQFGLPVDNMVHIVDVHCKTQSQLSAGHISGTKVKTNIADSPPFSIQKHVQSPEPLGGLVPSQPDIPILLRCHCNNTRTWKEMH